MKSLSHAAGMAFADKRVSEGSPRDSALEVTMQLLLSKGGLLAQLRQEVGITQASFQEAVRG